MENKLSSAQKSLVEIKREAISAFWNSVKKNISGLGDIDDSDISQVEVAWNFETLASYAISNLLEFKMKTFQAELVKEIRVYVRLNAISKDDAIYILDTIINSRDEIIMVPHDNITDISEEVDGYEIINVREL